MPIPLEKTRYERARRQLAEAEQASADLHSRCRVLERALADTRAEIDAWQAVIAAHRAAGTGRAAESATFSNALAFEAATHRR
jgi:chromosome segregation ATPase